MDVRLGLGPARAVAGVVIALVAMGAIGCGGDTIGRMVELQDEQVTLLCACPEVVGAPDAEYCRMTLEMYVFTDAQATCLRDVVSSYAEIERTLECQLDAGVRLNSCIRTALAMCPPADPDALTDCNQQFADETASCPSAPSDAVAAFEACLER